MVTQYDLISKEYNKDWNEEAILPKYVLINNLFKVLGNIKGKAIMDLACGNGIFTRIFKRAGASKVIGVDISKEQIKLAKEEEKYNPLGIEFYQEDALNLPVLGQFDFVAGTFLLHYSKTPEELFKMCEGAYKNLRKGGRFIALNQSPIHPLTPQSHKKYGGTVIPKNLPLKEGGEVIVTLFKNEKPFCSFTAYHWKKETYESAFKKAGFKNLKWHNPEVSPEGIKEKGKEFWEGFLKTKRLVIIEAEK